MESIPSESECYPAKLTHGHVQWLLNQGIKTIFYPCVFYEREEAKGAQNHYNCPIVMSYPENIKNNIEEINHSDITYIRPFMAFTNEQVLSKRLVQVFKVQFNIPAAKVKKACELGWKELLAAKADMQERKARRSSKS